MLSIGLRVTHYSNKFLNVQNHDVLTKKFCNFLTEYQMPVGLFMQEWTGNIL